MGQPDRLRTGQQDVVSRLVNDLVAVLPRLESDARPGERAVQQDIDLIESQPVMHIGRKLPETGFGIAQEKTDHFAAAPGAVLFHQPHGDVEMAERDQRLHAQPLAFPEQIPVECDAFGVGGRFIALGEKP